MASYGHELTQDLKVSGTFVILYRPVRMNSVPSCPYEFFFFFLKTEGITKCSNEINNKLISTRQHS